MPPTSSIRTVKIRAPTVAEQVGEAGFDPVADLAALPAEEEDEDEIDAEGDQEEPDQVEVPLLQPGGQMQPAFRLGRFGSFFPGFGFARRRALLANEHAVPVRRAGTHPCG